MTQLRSVNTYFWQDGFIASCTPMERYIFLYLLTHEGTTLAGCYELSLRRAAFDTGASRRLVQQTLEKFQQAGKIEFRDGWLVLNSFHKHQNLNANMGKAAAKVLNGAPTWVRTLTKENLERLGTIPEWFPNGSVTIKGREDEVEVEDEIEDEGKVVGAREVFISESIAGVMSELKLQKFSVTEKRDWENHATLAHENGFYVADFLDCFRLLRQQKWRNSPVAAKDVTKNLSNLAKLRIEIAGQNGKNSNSVGDSESSADALKRIGANPDMSLMQ